MSDLPMFQRQCGECNRCCDVMGVEELRKPPSTPCKNMCPDGCSIYEKRPRSCRDWSCLWLTGAMRGNERPDKLGCVMTPENGWLIVYLDRDVVPTDEIRRAARRTMQFCKLQGIEYHLYQFVRPYAFLSSKEYTTEYSQELDKATVHQRNGGKCLAGGRELSPTERILLDTQLA